MNNTIKIIIAGSIGIIVQKLTHLNSMSILGFAVFLTVFMIVSFIIRYLFPLKDAPKKYYDGQIRGLYFAIFLKIAFYPIMIFLIYHFIKYQRNKIYRM